MRFDWLWQSSLHDVLGVIDVAASTASAAALIFAAWVAVSQIREHRRLAARDRAVDSYFRYIDRFNDLSNLFRDSQLRFQNDDQDISFAMAKSYYRRYWQLQFEQWEFFTTGLLPVKIYSQWMYYVIDYFISGRDFEYFDSQGLKQTYTFADGFETDGKVLLRNQPECLDFFEALQLAATRTRPGDWADQGCPVRKAVAARVRKLAKDAQKDKRWELPATRSFR